MVLNIQNLIDDAKCFETVRELRWAGWRVPIATLGVSLSRDMTTRSLSDSVIIAKPVANGLTI